MSLFDILNSPDLRSTIGSFAEKAKHTASDVASSAPGGVGGLLGAGALGALIGSFVSKSVLKDAALVGAGAVAWNFYQKWSSSRNDQGGTASAMQTSAPFSVSAGSSAPVPGHREASSALSHGADVFVPDDTAMLLLRAMIYTARADGHIDAAEQSRIVRLVEQMFPGRDVSGIMESLMNEPINPALLASAVRSAEQGEDLYRLSCLIVDVDHFMERSYLEALASALHIAPARRTLLEQEASQARNRLPQG